MMMFTWDWWNCPLSSAVVWALSSAHYLLSSVLCPLYSALWPLVIIKPAVCSKATKFHFHLKFTFLMCSHLTEHLHLNITVAIPLSFNLQKKSLILKFWNHYSFTVFSFYWDVFFSALFTSWRSDKTVTISWMFKVAIENELELEFLDFSFLSADGRNSSLGWICICIAVQC